MKPEFKDEDPINPFDFWNGCNFKVKIRKIGGYTNYDKSEFDAPSALYGGDDNKIEKLWNQEHSLNEFISPSSFKSYDDLKNRLHEVLGGDIRGTAPAVSRNAEDLDENDFQEKSSSMKQKRQKIEDTVEDEVDPMKLFEQMD
jgi:hypothetical protein